MKPWACSIALGVLLDLMLGDPAFALHPVRLIGTLADQAERFFRSRLPPYPAGVASWVVVTATSVGAGFALISAAKAAFGISGEILVGGVIVWASIAIRDLGSHAFRVKRALDAENVAEARKRVGMIVGRRTETLDEAGVARAAVESVAESFVDGIAAPLLWAALLGPLGALGYRAANTMDSMFGHKNERYLLFGRFPAKADDALTWIPARLAGLVVCLTAPVVGGSVRGAFRSFFRDRLKHESPNSAHGEAAFAGALGLLLGGPTDYPEGTIDKPFIGQGETDCRGRDIGRAVRLMVAAAILWAALCALIPEAARTAVQAFTAAG